MLEMNEINPVKKLKERKIKNTNTIGKMRMVLTYEFLFMV